MSTTTHSSQEVIRLLFTLAALTARPTTWFAALHTGDPGVDGSANEVTGATDGDYERTAVTWDEDVVSGISRVSNDAEVAFPASAGASPYTIQFLSIWSAAVGGNCLATLPLTPSRSVAPGGIARFPIGEIIIEGASHDD